MPTTKNIETPEKLWDYFEAYKKSIEESPRIKYHITPRGDKVPEELRVPLTWVGFENWLFSERVITQLTHYEQNLDGRYDEYIPIITRIKGVIKQDQIEGGMVGQYNSNLTARLNGLGDKQEVKADVNVKKTKIKWGDKEIDV